MTYDLEVLFSRENKECIIPTKRDEDAGYDLYIDPVWLREKHNGMLIIPALTTTMIPTGIRSVIPETHYAQLEERGSTGTKAIKCGSGVIDSNFRGVWNIVITNCNYKAVVIYSEDISEDDYWSLPLDIIKYPSSKGLAQFVFLEVPKAKITEVFPEDILSFESERGEGKLGSSGK